MWLLSWLWKGADPWIYDNAAVLLCFRLVKWIVKLATGTFEIQRLLATSSAPSAEGHRVKPAAAVAVERSIVYSRALADLISDIHQPGADLPALSVAICKRKRSWRPPTAETISRLEGVLVVMNEASQLLIALDAVRVTRVDLSTSEHGDLARSLWVDLMPDKPVPRVPDAGWTSIGFQGADPTTDFRGMGLLGLTQLAFLAQTHRDMARALLRLSEGDGASSGRWFPFAVTGINLTAWLMDRLRKRQLREALFANGATHDTVHLMYVFAFWRLGVMWREDAGAVITAWPQFFARVCATVQAELESSAVAVARLEFDSSLLQ